MERVGGSEEKGKKGLVFKTLERCRSFNHRRSRQMASLLTKRKSWPRVREKQHVAPEGYFTVFVGPDRERFVIKTECVNHPLFKLLLDEAEKEYGFTRGGPLELPCDIELFHRVLSEIEQEAEDPRRRSFVGSSSRYQRLSFKRLIIIGQS